MYLASVYDTKLGQFNSPLAFPSKGVALRAFSDQVGDTNPENAFRKHPEDYLFYHIGDFDESNGGIVPCAPEQIAHAVDYV